VNAKRRASWLLAVAVTVALIAAGCGDDSDESGGGTGAQGDSEGQTDNGTGEGTEGGELIDLGTFVGDPPEHIDPALNVTLDAYQVVNALYDGLTEIDASTDPANPIVKPLVAESVESNDDATVWTFKIRSDAKFSNGEAITPTSFQRAWERASDPDFAGDYSYLFGFIKGGKEKLDGTAQTIEGVQADDASMTLTVTLAAPYSNFDAVAGFQLFFPMPSEVESLSDQNDWENGMMIGNGPYKLESPRTDQEIVVVRNENWAGDIFGNTSPKLDRIVFRTSADPDTAYNSFEAGEGDTANIPPGRVQEADDNYGTTLDVNILGSYHFEVKWDDPVVGGPENKLLRQAISQAIDREEINTAVYNGSRTTSTGIAPEGIPGWKADQCDYCAYDVDAAQKAFDDWQAAGHSLSAPIKIQFNAGAGHEDVVQIMIDNLSAIGIDAEAEPFPTETYFTQLTDGACQICRSGWYADYPTYDNFMYDLFHTDAIGGNNHGRYSNPEFDELVNEAKATVDKDEQGNLFNQAEEVLLNEDIGVIPINWYRGDYVYNDEKIANFPQTPLGLILWEQVSLNG
jgi:ABC-type oligopeptide transport system substrate-binding subunit